MVHRIRNATILGAPMHDPAVPAIITIESGQFQSISAEESPPQPLDPGDYDASGGYVIAGLIDGHVHLVQDARPGALQGATPEDRAITAMANLADATRAGITTVIDLGSPGETPYALKRAYFKGLLRSARPVVAGPILTTIGGHGLEESLPVKFGVPVVGEVSARTEVRRALASGADLIKLAVDATTTRTRLSRAEIAVVVEEAHAGGVKVTAHAHFDRQAIIDCIDAGCDVIQHGVALDRHLLERMADSGTAYCPTLFVHTAIQEHPEVYSRGCALTLAAARTRAGHRQAVHDAKERGVTIVAGSDAGMVGVGFGSLHDELKEFQACGLNFDEILASATRNVAAAFGLERLGEIRENARADMAVLGTDPRIDLRALRDVRALYVSGQAVLSRMNCQDLWIGVSRDLLITS